MRVFVVRLRVGLHGVLSPEQHGFCPGRSAVTGVTTLLPVLEQASRSPRGCHVLFLDITKAYDLVDRSVWTRLWHTWVCLPCPSTVSIVRHVTKGKYS